VQHGPTEGQGVQAIVPDANVVNLGGCPHNPANTVAVLVHYLTFGEMPALDSCNRPLFAYGDLVHDQCERRAYFDAGLFVEEWGDEGHRKGYCLYKMGCKGPSASYNCPNVRWNDGTSWPIQAGHNCIACASPDFWGAMSPFYERLPNVPGFGADTTAETVGLGLVGAVAAATVAHGAGKVVQARASRRPAVAPPKAKDAPTPPAKESDDAARARPPARRRAPPSP